MKDLTREKRFFDTMRVDNYLQTLAEESIKKLQTAIVEKNKYSMFALAEFIDTLDGLLEKYKSKQAMDQYILLNQVLDVYLNEAIYLIYEIPSTREFFLDMVSIRFDKLASSFDMGGDKL